MNTLAILLVLLGCSHPGLDGAAVSSEPVWKRVFVVGASASAGFRTRRETGTTITLAKALDVAIKKPHDKVGSAASSMFFLKPFLAGQTNVRQAWSAKPTLLVGIDFLFWFGYGRKESEEQRLVHLERGFRYLNSFTCPILVAKIPDMREAIGKILHSKQVPTPETILTLNKRIDAWAAKRKNVVLVPLVKFIDDLKKGKAVRVAGTRYPENSIRRLLQRDELHPTIEGIAAIGVLALDALAKKLDDVPSDFFEGDATVIAKRLRGEEKARAAGETRR
jgi:hypothetical protein